MLKPNLQSGLFKYQLKDSLCSKDQSNRLYKEGLLSFNPVKKESYEEFEIDELNFLKTIYFDSGLSGNAVMKMLSKLDKPFSYSFNNIYWDFSTQKWKELPQDPEMFVNHKLIDVIFDNFNEFLESVDGNDLEKLSIIRDSSKAKLKEIEIVEKN